MQFGPHFVVSAELDALAQHFVCEICLSVVYIPWELSPCEHLFCWKCAEGASLPIESATCPICRVKVELIRPPNRVISGVALQITGGCGGTGCQWKGTNEDFHRTHKDACTAIEKCAPKRPREDDESHDEQ